VTRIINMWAGPRNISTAMMYAWNQRADTTVIDEPMYAHYLRVTALDHPVREMVLAALPRDEEGVLDLIFGGDHATPLLFIKNMAHHLVGLDPAFIDDMDNFILTRDPARMLPSLARGLGRIPTMQDAAYGDQIEIVERVLDSGRTPIVVDSASVVADPRGTLRSLCGALDVPFDTAMLSWTQGPKDIDGVWGAHWYTRLHATIGFEPASSEDAELPTELTDIYDQCAPLYDRLSAFAI
jgi:hypothetical protein